MLGQRSVVSLFSHLVTRPTGRAIRTGVESQIAEMEGAPAATLSILDFSQVRVLDYSCADEVVAKLLLRYRGADRPAEVFFVFRGLHEHHVEPIEEVLERHGLVLVALDEGGAPVLLGVANPVHRAVWGALVRRGGARPDELSLDTGLPSEAVAATLGWLVEQRVAARAGDGAVHPLSSLLESDP